VGDLARYLMVSRQNLSGVIGRMQRDGHVDLVADPRDRRSRLVSMTEAGRRVWQVEAQPRIFAYYEDALQGISVNDTAHTLHYLLQLLENMQRIDRAQGGSDEAQEDAAAR